MLPFGVDVGPLLYYIILFMYIILYIYSSKALNDRRLWALGLRRGALGFRVGHQETTCHIRKPQRRDLHPRESLVGP